MTDCRPLSIEAYRSPAGTTLMLLNDQPLISFVPNDCMHQHISLRLRRLDAKREVLTRSPNDIANDIGKAFRDVGLGFRNSAI